jgi:hypothetical protein
MKWNPFELYFESKKEVYLLIDKNLRNLPKKSDGTIDELGGEFFDNDVDALRHSYVSGVFTQEYGETAAEIFGRLNEAYPGGSISTSSSENSTNMDLWNNSIGRKYGKKIKTRKELFNNLLKALKNGELIIDPNSDSRKYTGDGEIKGDVTGMVIVLNENKKGKNRIFYDVNKNLVLKKSEFVALIKKGNYPNYELRIIAGEDIPVSKKDNSVINNLG